MQTSTRHRGLRRLFVFAAILSAGLFQFAGACEFVTNYFDPCGTIFANCEPGSFQLQFADIPDWDVDPTCTIPGGCMDQGEPWEDPFGQFGPGFSGP